MASGESQLTTGDRKRPLYKGMMDIMEKRIRSGQLAPGSRAPSESDLIAEFRVSSTTARRCLDELERLRLVRRVQGKGTFVTSETQLPHHRQIGILYNELFSLAEGVSAHIFRGVSEVLDPAERHAMFLAAGMLRRSANPGMALRELVHGNNLEGVLVMSPLPMSWLRPILEEGIPLASVNFSYQDPRICSSVVDSNDTLHHLLGRLRKAGHRHIVLIRQTFPAEQLEGVALSPWDPSLAADLDLRLETFPYFGPDQTKELVDRSLKHSIRPTAFITIGYEMSLKVRHAIKAANLAIPDDVSLVFVGAPPGPSEIDGQVVPIQAMSVWATKAMLDWSVGRPPHQRINLFKSTPLAGLTLGQTHS
ncbi:MAG: GntR family transcriptional regulator [Phycisphaerales bacterium]|nr:GntR family transcriptional regulator [Phycisphaerales bacterium]